MAEILYADSGMKLLACIKNALKSCIDLNVTGGIYDDNLGKKIENSLHSSYPFLMEFHLLGNTKRLTKIVLNEYNNVQEYSKNSKGSCIPSPLAILYQMLTIPNEPQSAAYVTLFCRSLLFERFKVFPSHSLFPKGYTQFNISDINTHLEAIFKHYYNVHERSDSDNVYNMLIHYLALKGIFYLRFDDNDGAVKYLKQEDLSSNNMKFRKIFYYKDFPDASTLMNELAGIPIPIMGMDTIFQGGLKTNSKSNLVMKISGQAGTGKTSFALALSAAMAPFGTFSYYISLEEEPEDLENRLESLIPEYLDELLSKYNKRDLKSWFLADMVVPDSDNKEMEAFGMEAFIKEYINKISVALKEKRNVYDRNLLPSVCPLIIVIDNIRSFGREKNLGKFVMECRKLDALTIIISSPTEEHFDDIDYMVDVVINLKYEGTGSLKEKPSRSLQLLKTRHQISRYGTHVFHLSAKDGIHISPQLPSQIDKKETISRFIPSSEYYIDFFTDYRNKSSRTYKTRNLYIWDKSQLLLYGYESTGKAGLALTILLHPLRKSEKERPIKEDSLILSKRKVLIISLLYPEGYYSRLTQEIRRSYRDIINENNTEIECLCFYSGYLSPEDFINKILVKLDTAILEGNPFTGILLDGLHNATLQFPKLQKSDMVWGTLYSLLAKYRLTSVTTFTTFIVNEEEKNTILSEGGNALQEIIFQAADYSFNIRKFKNEDKLEDHIIENGQYVVSLKSAIRHKMTLSKDEIFIYDREELILYPIYHPPQNPQKTLPFNNDILQTDDNNVD